MQTFGPAFDHTVERELNRLAALVAAVEDCTVEECTFIVYLHRRSSTRFSTLTLNQYFVLQTGLSYLNPLTQCVLCQETCTFLFGGTVAQIVDHSVYVHVRILHCHLLGVLVQTVDETLFDQLVVGLQTFDTEQTLRLLLADGITNVLGHVNHLRVANVRFEALVHVLNELIDRFVGGGVGINDVVLDLRTVHHTERVVKRVVLALELDRLSLVRALSQNSFAFCFLVRRAGLETSHEEHLSVRLVHDGGVLVESVHESLEEEFLVENP